MDRAEIEQHIKVLRGVGALQDISERMQWLELELLLKIFDTLDKLPGMLDSIDDRLMEIEKHTDSTQHRLVGIEAEIGGLDNRLDDIQHGRI